MPNEKAPHADDATGASTGPEYRAARAAFDMLEPAEKAAFLLDAAFGSAGELVAEAARAVGDVIERAGQADFWRHEETSEAAGAAGAPRPRRPRATDDPGPAAE